MRVSSAEDGNIFVLFLFCEGYSHNVVLIMTVPCKTQNSKSAFLACKIWESHAYNPGFMMPVLL